ncbi:pyridine nucleotide-disulfide oxidoreductase [Streptomyces sp. AV19]|uniref:NAD(P)/FAD-dependent oxidoreductase n=1 Tax=Streptomyces sp. AV19 TaxID=2793068 RepID=UPI0018FF0C04|nr:FAD-binding protein [Streptomyces sp. AV19]MBH1935786.1 pyridine nucleotide-disulfide oxidoreductase [Streptomyces sp. AV19]MDG4535939.1 pyridine nucleotide-disulfide oxidoreductase [Streptomyces sp. AV19]
MSLRSGTGGRDAGDGHAVVIGSGLAGLTAAQALVDHMDRVTVVERDRLPQGPRRRRGVPHARHAHHLMPPGRQGLEQLFPGITRELHAAGMVNVRVPQDTLLLGPGGWIPRFEGELAMTTGSRDVLDAVVRDRLRADPKVTFLQEHEAVGLRAGRHDTVTGLWVRGRDRGTPGGWGEPRVIDAEFIVDASGDASRAPRWLDELGYGTPQETVSGTGTGCASALFAPPVGHVADWTYLRLMASPDAPREGVLAPVAGGKWMVSLSGGFSGGLFGSAGPDGLPAGHDGFLRAAGELRHPLLREVLEGATPLGPVYRSRLGENRWRHYERMRRWPDQFLVVGDALATFNPSYGHGMSVAVHCALLLDSLLRSHGSPVGVTYRLRQSLARQVASAWQAATTADFAPSRPEGTQPDLGTRLLRRYADRLAAAAPGSRRAAGALLEGQLLVDPLPPMRPGVLAAALRGPRRGAPTDPPSTTHGTPRRKGSPVKRVPGPPAAGVRGARPVGSPVR